MDWFCIIVYFFFYRGGFFFLFRVFRYIVGGEVWDLGYYLCGELGW